MELKGSFVALTTPFAASGAVDEPLLRRLVARQISAGTAGLVPCGTTGEAATLSRPEQHRVVSICLEEARGRVPVIAGVSGNDTKHAAELCGEAAAMRADGILLLAPYYTKPTQEGLYQHFRRCAQATELPIVVYNIPGRTAINIAPSTLVRLARDCRTIIGVKEAAGSLDQVSEIVASAPRGFSVLSGDDSLTLPMMAVGARGVVSVLANVAPRQTAELCAAFFKRDLAKAQRLHKKFFPLIKALFLETNPIPVKHAMSLLGFGSDAVRLPMTPLSKENRAKLAAELRACGLL